MPRKAQLFIVTVVFMVGLIFSVQQILFQYSELDPSTPFSENDIYLLENTKGLISQTIKSTPECSDFSVKMEELKDFLNTRVTVGGYALSLSYRLNCAYWGNAPPATPPLNMTMQIVGKGSETTSIVYLYNK